MKKSAFLVTVINGVVTSIQIVGQIAIARIFGARFELDAFVSAVTIPTLLTSVISATLSDAFLPLLKKHQHVNLDESNIYFLRMVLRLGVLIFLLGVVLDIFSEPLISIMFGVRGESFIKTSDSLMQIMLYTLPFATTSVFASSYFYSQQRYFLPSVGYLIGSLANLVFIVLLAPVIGIWSMVVGFISATLFQLLIIYPYKLSIYLGKAISSFSANAGSELKSLIIVWAPLLISSLILRFDGILTRTFAARLPEGYIVYVNLVTKLFSGLVGIMTIGIQTVFFPHLVELIHSNRSSEVDKKVVKAKLYGSILSACTVLFIFVVAPFFMRLLLTGGNFSSANVEVLVSLFPFFMLPAVGWGISQIFFQPIIAIGKQYYLTIINSCAVLFSWISATIAYNVIGGMEAISIGLIVLSFTGIIGAEILWRIERKKLLQSHT